MLHMFKAKEDKLEFIPAVLHLDNSARVQTINSNENPILYDIICKFNEKTSIPILCNTSLNDKGEPIVNRIEEAFNFSLRKGIKIIYINKRRIELYNHDKYPDKLPLKRPITVTKYSDEEKERIWAIKNPHNIPREMLMYCKKRADLDFLKTYDITNKIHAEKLIRAVKTMQKLEKDNPDVGVMYNE